MENPEDFPEFDLNTGFSIAASFSDRRGARLTAAGARLPNRLFEDPFPPLRCVIGPADNGSDSPSVLFGNHLYHRIIKDATR